MEEEKIQLDHKAIATEVSLSVSVSIQTESRLYAAAVLKFLFVEYL